MKLTSGHSEALLTPDAIREVIAACEGVDQPVGALLWMSPEYDAQEIAEAINKCWPDLPLVGCTSDGIFSSGAGLSHEGVLLSLISGEGIRTEMVVAEKLSVHGSEAVRAACSRLSPGPALSFVFPSPGRHDVNAAVLEAERVLQSPLVGACSADHREFTHCREIAGPQTYTDSMPILAVYGPIEVAVELGSGWSPVGRQFRATRVEGHKLIEINGASALQMLSDYYGFETDEALVEFPFAVQLDEDSEPFYRAIFGVDHETGILTLGGGISEGSILRMSEVLPDKILSASSEALDRNLAELDQPSAAFMFNCAGRKWVMGSAAEEEVSNLLGELSGVPTVGIYGFGEIGKLASKNARTPYHNETCVSVLVRSRQAA